MKEKCKTLGVWLGLGLLTISFAAAMFRAGFYAPMQTVHAQSIGWPDPPYTPVNVSFSSSATQTLVAAPTAGAVCVYELSLTNSGGSGVTVNVYLDGGTTSVSSAYLPATGGNAYWDLKANPKSPWFITNLTTGFAVKTSGAVQINGSVYAATCP